MSKKSRRRNKKILGALAAGLGAMALGGKGTASLNPVGGVDAIVQRKAKRDAAIDLGIAAAEADKASDMLSPTPIRTHVRRGNFNYKKGGKVTGAAKRGFGRALMKGKK